MPDLKGSSRTIYDEDPVLGRAGHGLGTVLEPAPVPPDGMVIAVEVAVTFPENGEYEVRFLR